MLVLKFLECQIDTLNGISRPLVECQPLLIKCPASLVECHISLMKFNSEEGLLTLQHALGSGRVYRLLCQRLTVGLVDRSRGGCVYVNLLDHGGVAGHEAGEGALDDAAEVGGYCIVQD